MNTNDAAEQLNIPNFPEPTEEEKKASRVMAIADRLMMLEAMLGTYKTLFSEKDALVLELMSLVGVGTEVTVGDDILTVVDNFAEKNTVFRQAAVKRFDLTLDSVKVRSEKALKKSAKSTKEVKS